MLHDYATTICRCKNVAVRTDARCDDDRRRDHDRRRNHDWRRVSGRYISIWHAVAHAVAVGAAVKAEAAEISHLHDLRRGRLSPRDRKRPGTK
jgi:hypothetical protein